MPFAWSFGSPRSVRPTLFSVSATRASASSLPCIGFRNRRRACGGVPAPNAARLDRLELLERLATRVAVAHAPARRGAEEVLQGGVGRVAVRTAEAALQPDERRRRGLPRRRRREARFPEFLAARRRDLVRRPRIVEDDPDVRFRSERAHLVR